jgi:hypothetical protein
MSFVPDLSARLIACINTWNLRARTDIYIYVYITIYIHTPCRNSACMKI